MPNTDLYSQIGPFLVDMPGSIDVGHTDECIIDVEFTCTAGYADWVKKRGKDVAVMQASGMGALSSCGSGVRAVQTLVCTSLAVVENLIEAGVPREVALKLLPHELYERIQKK